MLNARMHEHVGADDSITLKLFSVQTSLELKYVEWASLVIHGYGGNLKLWADCAPKGKDKN